MVVPNGTTIFISVAPHSVAPCRLDVAAQAVKRCRRRSLDGYPYNNIYGYIDMRIA